MGAENGYITLLSKSLFYWEMKHMTMKKEQKGLVLKERVDLPMICQGSYLLACGVWKVSHLLNTDIWALLRVILFFWVFIYLVDL